MYNCKIVPESIKNAFLTKCITYITGTPLGKTWENRHVDFTLTLRLTLSLELFNLRCRVTAKGDYIVGSQKVYNPQH